MNHSISLNFTSFFQLIFIISYGILLFNFSITNWNFVECFRALKLRYFFSICTSMYRYSALDTGFTNRYPSILIDKYRYLSIRIDECRYIDALIDIRRHLSIHRRAKSIFIDTSTRKIDIYRYFDAKNRYLSINIDAKIGDKCRDFVAARRVDGLARSDAPAFERQKAVPDLHTIIITRLFSFPFFFRPRSACFFRHSSGNIKIVPSPRYRG